MLTRKKLFQLAKNKGLNIIEETDKISIQNKSVIIVFYPQYIVRGDVDLALAKNMQVKEAAEALGLSE